MEVGFRIACVRVRVLDVVFVGYVSTVCVEHSAFWIVKIAFVEI